MQQCYCSWQISQGAVGGKQKGPGETEFFQHHGERRKAASERHQRVTIMNDRPSNLKPRAETCRDLAKKSLKNGHGQLSQANMASAEFVLPKRIRQI